MSGAALRPASPAPVRAFAPSATDLPLLRERLRQLGSDVPVLTSPVVSQPDGVSGHALLWSWTAAGIEALGRFAGSCQHLDVALLVGMARWVPLDTVLEVLASAGLTPRAATLIEVGGHRGIELAMTRGEVPASRLALALLELVTWSAPWHRGRQQPLRLAVEGATPHDLRDHPHASDTREVWPASPAALRLASPEIVLIGEQADHGLDPATRASLSDGGTPVVDSTVADDALRRPSLAAETLLLAPRGLRSETSPGWAGEAAPTVTVLQQLAAGTPVDLMAGVRRQLAPEVVMAAESPDLGTGSTVPHVRARTRLRWSVLRHHSAAGLATTLEAHTGRELAPRPRLSLCLDATARDPATGLDGAIRQLATQRRRPDEVVLLAPDGADGAEELSAHLRRALDADLVIAGTQDATRAVTGDLVVVAPLDARLATDALADLELAHRLWSPTVSVIPIGYVVDHAGRIHRTRAERTEGQSEGLDVPATIGVVAVAGRELRAHWRAGELTLDRREELVSDAVRRGAMVYTMPSIRAVFQGTPATLAGSRQLDVEVETLLVADRAGW